MNYSINLKNRLKKNAHSISSTMNLCGSERESAYIFKNVSMSFHEMTYQNILSNEDWEKRTKKIHSHFNDGTLEMQSSNSSDALLMNIFCYPEFQQWKGPTQLLSIDSNSEIEFGWNPKFDNENIGHPTEIDAKIGNHIFEAKLTEESFTTKTKDVVRRYGDFNTVFDEDLLLNNDGNINNYQLVRNILTAYKYNFDFTVLLDESRIDLIREFLNVIKAVRISNLKKKIGFLTWQELSDVCGKKLKDYIISKYF